MSQKLTLNNLWVESAAITAAFLAVSVLCHDPLSLHSVFPWIWFAPVMIALRYGIWPSLASIGVLLCAYLYSDPAQIYTTHLQLVILGGFLLTLFCAGFQAGWSRKINDSEEISNYLQKRIQTIAYAHKVLALAYERLEHQFIEKPVTLRGSLGELRECLGRSPQPNDPAILERFLNIVTNHCALEVAAIFPIEQERLIQTPIVSIGKMTPPHPMDYLLQACIQRSAIAHVTTSELLKGHISDYLIAAPFIDQANKIYAVLLVKEMPFLSLNNENLAIIRLLLQYFIDGNRVSQVELILQRFPDCSIDFANELQRLFNVQKKIKQDSAVVVFLVSDQMHQDDYLFALKQEKRGLDTLWETVQGRYKQLVILMPMIGRAGVDSYQHRIEDMFLKKFNVTLNNSEITFKSAQLSSVEHPIDLIQDLLSIP